VSNAWPGRFLDLLAQTEGPVLDCGSGGRWHERIVNIDPIYTPWNTVTADGTQLPFPDETFTLTLSQAVLEHCIDPPTYIAEIYRTLKPGGLLYIEAAFIQPIHMAPMHYQNFTPFGLAYICRAFETVDSGAMGWFHETIAWLCRASGVNPPKQRVKEPKGDGYLQAASGVWLLGRKPLAA
jgi:SAM-dependent methyltransferase